MRNLAIIPARGGSKRIPRKNIKDFLGKPIIAYSIEVAINSRLFDEVIVSTDDKEISTIAKQYGAKVPFYRSAKSSNDFATLADVIDEVKNNYIFRNIKFDNICCILSTAPFLNVDIINNSYELFVKKNVDSLRPIVRFSYPIQRAVKFNNGKISMFHPEYQNYRSQDLEPAFHDAGLFYWMKFERGLRGQDKFAFEIPEIMAQDIDTEQDWAIAEIKYNILLNKNENTD